MEITAQSLFSVKTFLLLLKKIFLCIIFGRQSIYAMLHSCVVGIADLAATERTSHYTYKWKASGGCSRHCYLEAFITTTSPAWS